VSGGRKSRSGKWHLREEKKWGEERVLRTDAFSLENGQALNEERDGEGDITCSSRMFGSERKGEERGEQGDPNQLEQCLKIGKL